MTDEEFNKEIDYILKQAEVEHPNIFGHAHHCDECQVSGHCALELTARNLADDEDFDELQLAISKLLIPSAPWVKSLFTHMAVAGKDPRHQAFIAMQVCMLTGYVVGKKGLPWPTDVTLPPDYDKVERIINFLRHLGADHPNDLAGPDPRD